MSALTCCPCQLNSKPAFSFFQGSPQLVVRKPLRVTYKDCNTFFTTSGYRKSSTAMVFMNRITSALLCVLLICALGSAEGSCAKACNTKFTACKRACGGPHLMKCVTRCALQRRTCYRVCSSSGQATCATSKSMQHDGARSADYDSCNNNCTAWLEDCNATCPVSKGAISRMRRTRKNVRSSGGSCMGTCDQHSLQCETECEGDESCSSLCRSWRDDCYTYCPEEGDIPGDTCGENCDAYYHNCANGCPTPPPTPPGGPCTIGETICAEGYECATSGTCNRVVEFDLTVIPDDSAQIIISGTNIGKVEPAHTTKTFTYTGPCDDIMVEVQNTKSAGPQAASILLNYDGETYGTLCQNNSPTDDATPMYAVVTESPTGEWYLNKPDYDFSAWTNAVCCTECSHFAEMEAQGGFPLTNIDKYQPIGKFGMKIKIPFC